jgi:ubiquinol-cytochrome c reductase cytochrome b subunit
MSHRASDRLEDPVRFIDERTTAAPLLRKSMRYLFPDHWSFLLGEVALYAFLVLIATGVYLALFFDPSTAKTVYHGSYTPLDGQTMSAAYKSVLDISFTYKAGLLIRQTHHWAADVFVASIVMHLMRVFFTGAFRKPRELTWLIGLTRGLPRLLAGRRPAVGHGARDRLPRRPVDPGDRRPVGGGDLRRAVPGQVRVLVADVHRPRS